MMTTTPLITSRDQKGLHAVGLFEAAYNKAGLTQETAQRLNENGGEFQAGILQLIQKHSATNQYASEEVSSSYYYPGEYTGPKAIEDQIKKIGELFGLNTAEALEYSKNLPELPAGAEGWFAIPKVSSVAKKHFPAITDSGAQYCEAVILVLKKIAETRSFYNAREGEILPAKLRQSARTLNFLEQLEAAQPGDILIVAAQYGLRHRGKSVRRARETFIGNEFGLGAFAIGCMDLVHPERRVRWEELDTDAAGDEFSPDAGGSFSGAPIFFFDGGVVGFGANDVSEASGLYGSASGFVPQA